MMHAAVLILYANFLTGVGSVVEATKNYLDEPCEALRDELLLEIYHRHCKVCSIEPVSDDTAKYMLSNAEEFMIIDLTLTLLRGAVNAGSLNTLILLVIHVMDEKMQMDFDVAAELNEKFKTQNPQEAAGIARQVAGQQPIKASTLLVDQNGNNLGDDLRIIGS